MRTTLDIDDDILAAAKELSRRQGCSIGKVVSMLTRRALTEGAGDPSATPAPAARRPPGVGGFRPFGSRGSPVTNAAIDALRDAEGA
jgi:hypothetical protein